MEMKEKSSERRELVRAEVNFPVILGLADNGKKYGEKVNTRAVDLSGVGMLLSVDLDDTTDMPKGTEVSLKFQLPNVDYELPPIKGTVRRISEPEEDHEQYKVGIEFDDFVSTDPYLRVLHKIKQTQTEIDQKQIVKYVVKRAVYNYSWKKLDHRR